MLLLRLQLLHCLEIFRLICQIAVWNEGRLGGLGSKTAARFVEIIVCGGMLRSSLNYFSFCMI